MENTNDTQRFEETPEEGYVPRPAWQVWMARIGLVFFLLFVVWQLIQIATGGLL